LRVIEITEEDKEALKRSIDQIKRIVASETLPR
jgi:CRISPR/Cas system-associated exonuclease Cas4 (RecB family)